MNHQAKLKAINITSERVVESKDRGVQNIVARQNVSWGQDCEYEVTCPVICVADECPTVVAIEST